MRTLAVVVLAAWFACDDSRFVRSTSGAAGPGPDFNGGFDRRPCQSFPLADGGVIYEFPTSIPDGWSIESGVWNAGIHALYGEGFDGGAPIMCRTWSNEPFPCPGTGAAPNNSALMQSVCWPYNGGCTGSNVLRSMSFPVVGGATYVLSAMMHGGFEYITTPSPAITANLIFRIEWLAGTSSIGSVSVSDNAPLTQTWEEHRFSVDAPANATQAIIRIDLPRAKRDVRIDNLALTPL